MDTHLFESVKNELFQNILPYWTKYAKDTQNQGFFGKIDNQNQPDYSCERSIVMTSRFLWTYSAVARYTKDPSYLEMADFAYDVIISKYWDKTNGGVYWSVISNGTPKVSKKQIYGEAFCCYGLSEYAAALKELVPELTEKAEESMNYALDVYNLIEQYALDCEYGGYIEACSENWGATQDMILSIKDMNCPKSMNTNLHVMEAYTNLYRTLPAVFPDADAIRSEVGQSLSSLIRITTQYILGPDVHLDLFFDSKWNSLVNEISYGHDIEASWLLWEAASELRDEELKAEIHDTVIRIAQTSLEEGFDKENGCLENFTREGIRNRNRVWWNQAEAVNGYYNAWEMTGDEKYYKACEQQWNWIINHQVDKENGEWWNELDPQGIPILTEDKGGNWKTSYHNGRACLELLRRLQKI